MIMRFVRYVVVPVIFGVLYVQPSGAVLLSFVPSSATVTTGGTVNVDVRLSGLGNHSPPSVGSFDLFVGFNPTILSPTAVTFGPFLGDPLFFESLTSFDPSTTGIVEFAEVSLLLPSQLDALQPSSFSLATLSFSAIGNGTSPFILVGTQRVDDAFGDRLAIPESATALLFGLGLVALLILRSPMRKIRDRLTRIPCQQRGVL
jgi:hypothetical protein